MRENPRTVRLRVGTNVRRLRHQRGWSQERLAELTGKNNKHIGQIERGEVNVSLDTLTAIAGGLSVPIVDLVGPAVAAADEPPARPYAMARRRAQQIERAAAKLRRLKQAAKRR